MFPAYSIDETIDILSQNCPDSDYEDLYLGFVNLVCRSYKDACRDITELQYLLKHLFPRYIAPIKEGKVARDQTSKLFTMINSLLKDHLDSLYLREVSSYDFESNHKLSRLNSMSFVNLESNGIELPKLTKYLVIAAYLASYNPPRLDARFFTRGGDARKSVGKKGGVHNGSKKRTQLLGPRTFPLERMLAIFFSIVNDDIKSTFDIHSQVCSHKHRLLHAYLLS
jgi:origin recognition complex subunit 5